MDSDEHNGDHNFEVGDVVRESVLIIPPDRKPWSGIVVYVEKDHYELHSFLGQLEDLIAVHWFQGGYIETLPASVLRMIQKADKKIKENS
tara:strand:+ start:62 stop:331 length:270 start_codon:yes stop_codon:yes gene_type:complete